jgi:predicted PurR-regulated permease PerM
MLGIDSTAARRAWSAVFVLLLVAGLFLIRQTLLVFVVAILFAYLLCPLVEFNQRRIFPRSRTFAALFPFAVFLITVTATGFIIRASVQKELVQLSEVVRNPQFKGNLIAWKPGGIPVGRLVANNYGSVLTMLPKNTLVSELHATVRDAGDLVLIPILAFFFLRDGSRVRDALVALLYGGEHNTPFFRKGKLVCISLLSDAHVLILDYMRALMLQCGSTFVAYSIVLYLLGAPWPVLLGLVAFPLEFVPLVGPLLSATTILAVCAFSKFSYAIDPHSVPPSVGRLNVVWVLVFLAVYRIFQDYVLSPLLMKRGVKLHPLLIIFGILAGGEIGGVAGVFLSVPIIALARLLFFEWRKPEPGLAVEELEIAATTVEFDAVG